MSCTSKTLKGKQCGNKAKYDNLCHQHYKIEIENRKRIEQIENAKYCEELKQELNQQYKDVCELLSMFGLNNSLINLILVYRTDHRADLSWKYNCVDYQCTTFDSKGNHIYCSCLICHDSEYICCIRGECNHREINRQLNHCVYCGCSNCICELTSSCKMGGEIMKPALENPCDGFCFICKSANLQPDPY